MPAGNRMGPWGLGPRTGRGLGYCAGFPVPGSMFPGYRFGFGRGFGFGKVHGRGLRLGRGPGFRHPWFGHFWAYPYPPLAPDQYSFGASPYYPYPPIYGQSYSPGYPSRQSSSAPEEKE